LQELDETESITEKEMNELCRNADRLTEELQKTDPVKTSECRSHIERLQVLLSIESDVTLYRILQYWIVNL